MACALEDAGFEIRDSLMWLYATGFPTSYDVAQCIEKRLTTGRDRRPDRDLGATRDRWSGSGEGTLISDTGGKVPLTTPEAAAWGGWGTALKPAYEPIVLARKPLRGTVAANVLAQGAGALNVDVCRVPSEAIACTGDGFRAGKYGGQIGHGDVTMTGAAWSSHADGGWPANVLHDGSDEVEAAFPAGASRFFFSAKASAADRLGSKHPTVKPVALMRWLCRLLTPTGGVVVDPFAGTGTTGEAAAREGFHAVLFEQYPASVEDIRVRMGALDLKPAERRALHKLRRAA